jgi:hypothetical protein
MYIGSNLIFFANSVLNEHTMEKFNLKNYLMDFTEIGYFGNLC